MGVETGVGAEAVQTRVNLCARQHGAVTRGLDFDDDVAQPGVRLGIARRREASLRLAQRARAEAGQQSAALHLAHGVSQHELDRLAGASAVVPGLQRQTHLQVIGMATQRAPIVGAGVQRTINNRGGRHDDAQLQAHGRKVSRQFADEFAEQPALLWLQATPVNQQATKAAVGEGGQLGNVRLAQLLVGQDAADSERIEGALVGEVAHHRHDQVAAVEIEAGGEAAGEPACQRGLNAGGGDDVCHLRDFGVQRVLHLYGHQHSGLRGRRHLEHSQLLRQAFHCGAQGACAQLCGWQEVPAHAVPAIEREELRVACCRGQGQIQGEGLWRYALAVE